MDNRIMHALKTLFALGALTTLAACGSDSDKFEGVWANGKGGYMLINKGATEVKRCIDGLGADSRILRVKAEGDVLKVTEGDGKDIHYTLKDDKPVINGGKADYFKSDEAAWAQYCS